MRTKNLKPVVVSLLALALTFTGCSGSGGDTDGGSAGDEQFTDDPFVPTDDNSGSIELIVKQTNLAIGEISGFSVVVRDANGAPVPLTRVACDSELGVAIIEPTTGAEITDSDGQISGKVGCALPGSLLFGCRLPVGGNKRKFVTMKCEGDVPAGFDGFAGSAGGQLGTGGVDIDEEEGGGPGGDSDNIRIASAAVRDNPSASDQEGVQVDVSQGICTPDDPTTTESELVVEPFGDTFTTIKVVNNTNSDIRFNSLKYSVPNAGGGGTFKSSSIAFIGESTAAAEGGEATLNALIFSATGSGADKFFVNLSSGNLGMTSLGFRNVTFTITGTNSLGETVTVSAQTALSFSNYSRCSS